MYQKSHEILYTIPLATDNSSLMISTRYLILLAQMKRLKALLCLYKVFAVKKVKDPWFYYATTLTAQQQASPEHLSSFATRRKKIRKAPFGHGHQPNFHGRDLLPRNSMSLVGRHRWLDQLEWLHVTWRLTGRFSLQLARVKIFPSSFWNATRTENWCVRGDTEVS